MTEPRTRTNRRETERRLIDAALDLIRRNGVLAGLNLREVAEAAGVNRGNIYHYFGSRRDLLRAAIARRFEAAADSMAADLRGTPFIARRLRAFRSSETIRDSEMRALLVIDGDESVDPMPRFEEVLSSLRQDVIDGQIDRAQDLEALQVALNALLRGYRIFRSSYARRLQTTEADLDERVVEIARQWLESMASPPAPGRTAQEERTAR